jgi:hypothetical protein
LRRHDEGGGGYQPDHQAGQEAIATDQGHEAVEALPSEHLERAGAGATPQGETDQGGDQGTDPAVDRPVHRAEGHDGGGDQDELRRAEKGQQGKGGHCGRQGPGPVRRLEPAFEGGLAVEAEDPRAEDEDQSHPAEQQEGHAEAHPGAGIQAAGQPEQPAQDARLPV